MNPSSPAPAGHPATASRSTRRVSFRTAVALLAVPAALFAAAVVLGRDNSVAAKMLALHPHFDANRDGSLSGDEQTRAIAAVREQYGDSWSAQIQRMFHHAGGGGSVTAETWRKEVADYDRVPAKQTTQLAARDGTKLATDVHLPSGTGPFPVVLARTPYGRESRQEAAQFTGQGFAYVAQDMRGRFGSGGENAPFIGCGWEKHQDGLDTVDWIRRQPWCNGKIATFGGSAGGITQNLLAAAGAKDLAAQYISVAAADLYQDAVYTGGALRKVDTENWTRNNKFAPQALAEMLAHPNRDAYWDAFDTTNRFDRMDAPAVHLGGWFDIFVQGTIDSFLGRQHHGGPRSRGSQKLVIGPWAHATGKTPVGDLRFPDSKVPDRYSPQRWFDHYLHGVDNGVEREPAVAYYVMGDTSSRGAPGNRWRFVAAWPPPANETAYHFSADGSLTTKSPAAGDDHREFTFDPANPCPTTGGNNLTIDAGPRNQNRIENRPDVLVFSTQPLQEPVEVTGRVRAKIHIATTAVDTDLSVRLCDVYPDGKSYQIAEGMLRLRHRKSLADPEPMVPGQAEEVVVDCWSTSIVFAPGHRIRAIVTSSNFPRFDLNPGTGKPWSDPASAVKQTNRIFCNAAKPSCLLLPVIAPSAKE